MSLFRRWYDKLAVYLSRMFTKTHERRPEDEASNQNHVLQIHGNVDKVMQIGQVYGNVNIERKPVIYYVLSSGVILLFIGMPMFFYSHREPHAALPDKALGTVQTDVTVYPTAPTPQQSAILSHKGASLSQSPSIDSKSRLLPKNPRQNRLNLDLKIARNDPATGNGLHPYNSDSPDLDQLWLTYGYERTNDGIRVRPRMDYLARLRSKESVYGIPVSNGIAWNCPKLSVRTVNNSSQTLLLTEMRVTVLASKVNLDPVLLVGDNEGGLRLYNIGWGPALKPSLKYKLAYVEGGYRDLCESDDSTALFHNFNHTQRIATIPSGSTIAVDGVTKVVHAFEANHQSRGEVTMFGVLDYDAQETGHKSMKFAACMDPGGGGGDDYKVVYDLDLTAGKSGYVLYRYLSQSVKSGEVDNFAVRMRSDKSAVYDLELSFKDAGGQEICKRKVQAEIFVPRPCRTSYRDSENKLVADDLFSTIIVHSQKWHWKTR